MQWYFPGDLIVLRLDQLRVSLAAWDQGLNCVFDDFSRLCVPNQGWCCFLVVLWELLDGWNFICAVNGMMLRH